MLNTTQGMSTGAAGMSRKGAEFVRESEQLPDADRLGDGVVSKSNSSTTESGPAHPSAQGNRRDENPSTESSRITDRDIGVIQKMTAGTDLFERIGRGLRSGNLSPSDRAFVEELRTAIAKLRSYSGTVFRGAHLYLDALARYQKGSIVTEPAFTSTSKRKSGAFGGNTHFKIRSSTGKVLGRYSAKPHEKEVIFPPGTRFEVVDVKYNKHWRRTDIELVDRGIAG